jgi:hypothetical protein
VGNKTLPAAIVSGMAVTSSRPLIPDPDGRFEEPAQAKNKAGSESTSFWFADSRNPVLL